MTENATHGELAIDPIIRAEVRRIWREWIGMDPDLTSTQRENLIEAEAARLTEMVDETVGDSPHGFLMEQWKAEHPGQEPDFPTAVALIETAHRSATNKILETELYPQLTAEMAEQVQAELDEIEQAAVQEARRLRELRDPQRWRRSMVELTDLAVEIVSRVWGMTVPFEFRILALSLVQQRLEDNERTPLTSSDPMREVLESMIDEQLRSVEQGQSTPF